MTHPYMTHPCRYYANFMNHSAQYYKRTEQRLYFNPGGIDGDRDRPRAPNAQPFAPQHP